MFNNDNFRKRYLLPVTYCGVLAMAIWSGDALIPNGTSLSSPLMSIEPAAGEADASIPKVNEADLKDVTELPALDATAKEGAPLRISPDKPEMIQLDRDAVNVMVGSEETLRAVPDTNRTIVLIPKKPGATFFKAIDADGKVIMQRHVIVGAVERSSKYLRIRRACAEDDKGCQQFSMYYCPDACHEVSVIQGDKAAKEARSVPDIAPAIDEGDGMGTTEYVEPSQPAPKTE